MFNFSGSLRTGSERDLIEARDAFRNGTSEQRADASRWLSARDTRMAEMASTPEVPASTPEDDYDSWAERMLGMELARVQADEEDGR